MGSQTITNWHNFVRMNIITPNYIYYKIVQLTLWYEYHTTPIFHKTQVRYIRNCYLNELFKIFNIFGHISTQNFIKINTPSPNYAY
jgi:hypothetical protein